MTLEVGRTAPAFALPTPYGEEVKLVEWLAKGPVVVEFLRGTWDPDTRGRLRDLAAAEDSLRGLSAGLLAIMCERPGTAGHYLANEHVPFPVLIDAGRRVTRAYGVLQRFAFPMWNVARPSSFVIDRCGYVRYAYVAKLSVHAAEIESLLEALRRCE